MSNTENPAHKCYGSCYPGTCDDCDARPEVEPSTYLLAFEVRSDLDPSALLELLHAAAAELARDCDDDRDEEEITDGCAVCTGPTFKARASALRGGK